MGLNKQKFYRNFSQNNERGFVSFFALMTLIAAAFVGSELFFIMKENIETERHKEIALQLRYDAESAVEKIAFDVENKTLIVMDDIKVVAKTNLPEINDNNKTLNASIKLENNGLRIFAVAEKIDEPYTTLGVAEGFMEKTEDGYKWKYWIKVKSN